MSAYGIPGAPCVEDRACEVGLSKSVLTRHGMRNWWNDKQPNAAHVSAALRRAATREGGCRQAETRAQQKQQEKDTRKARQHPGAAPANTSGSRLVLMLIAVVLMVAVVHHYSAAILFALHIALLAVLGVAAVAGGVWSGHALAETVDWDHVTAWWGRNQARVTARRAQRVELAEKRAAWLEAVPERQPIALGPVAPVSADEVLKATWTAPAEQPYVVHRD